MLGRAEVHTGRIFASWAWSALLACVFVFVGATGRYLAQAQPGAAFAPATAAAPAAGDASAEPPALRRTTFAHVGEDQARLRQAPARKATALRPSMRGPASDAPGGALNGAAFALAIAARARERAEAPQRLHGLLPTNRVARGPPLLG